MLAAVTPWRPAAALDSQRLISQYVVERWGVDRGYPGGAIHDMAQSGDGDLWLATDKGLIRFDGLAFRTVPVPAAGPGARRAVLGVTADAAGTVWIRLQGPRLLRIDNGRPVEVALPDTVRNVVTSMRAAADGALLIAPIGDGVLQLQDGQARMRVPLASLPSSFVVSMVEGRDGTLWLGTPDRGVLQVRGSDVVSWLDGLPDRKVNALAIDARDHLWIATDAGVARLADGRIALQPVPTAAGTGAVGLAHDRDANLWVALGRRGLARITAAGQATVLPWDPAQYGDATAVFEDRDGTLWVGTSRGLVSLRDGVFATLTARHGLPAESGGAIGVDGAGRVWLAPPQGGLLWYEGGTVHVVADPAIRRDVVYSIAGTRDGVWIGRQRGGLSRLRPEGRTVRVDAVTSRDGLAQDSVYAVHAAGDGSVWAGTVSAGLSRVRGDVLTTITQRHGLPSNTITAIAEGRDGRVWVGTPAGVAVQTGATWQVFDRRHGLPSDDVAALAAGGDGTVWIGTAAGLAFARDGRVHTVASVPLLAAGVVGLTEDAAAQMWIVTGDGVFRAPAARLRRADVDEADFQRFDLLDGLASTEGVRRHRSVVRTGSQVWLSLTQGLSHVDVTRLDRPVAVARRSRIDAVIADDVAVDARRTRVVPARTRRLTFAFDDDGLTLPGRVRFRYRLDGFDDAWSVAAPSRTVAYTNLSPRTYTFRVAAVDGRGRLGPEERLTFQVRPAFWQTIWFGGVVALGIAGLGWGAYRWRLRRLARQLTWAFEERLAERTRVAQDLHDTLLQGCLAASMQLHLAVDRLPDEAPARPAMERVLQLLTRVVDEGRAAVRGLRADVADDLERALARVPGELAPASAAAVRVIVEGQPRTWHPVVRDEVYRIAREALTNALRHAVATHIDITVSYDADGARVSVRDDGQGMDDATRRQGRDGHWGLPGMKERAESIGATVRVFSREGAGTEVVLAVPASAAFVTADAPSRRRWWQRRPRARTTMSPGTGS